VFKISLYTSNVEWRIENGELQIERVHVTLAILNSPFSILNSLRYLFTNNLRYPYRIWKEQYIKEHQSI